MNDSQIANSDHPKTASTTQTASDPPIVKSDNSGNASINQAAQPKTKKRLNLELTPEAYELLQQVVDDSGKSMADVLRAGLALYGIAQEESQQGRTLAIAEGDKVIKQIVII